MYVVKGFRCSPNLSFPLVTNAGPLSIGSGVAMTTAELARAATKVNIVDTENFMLVKLVGGINVIKCGMRYVLYNCTYSAIMNEKKGALGAFL